MKKDSVIGVIPVRYNSSRLPGKPFIPIGGKPLLQRVYQRASGSKDLDKIMVATDDRRIVNLVSGFGGEVVLTSGKPRSGTDRVAEAVRGSNHDIVLNIQGDEPFLKPEMLDELIGYMRKNRNILMGTLAMKAKDRDFFKNPNRVKVVLDKAGDALYFSRFPIPFSKNGGNKIEHYEHIGVYAFRKNFLKKYARMKQTPLEKSESLEQLRVLENGYRIRVLLTRYGSKSINSSTDLKGLKKRS